VSTRSTLRSGSSSTDESDRSHRRTYSDLRQWTTDQHPQSNLYAPTAEVLQSVSRQPTNRLYWPSFFCSAGLTDTICRSLSAPSRCQVDRLWSWTTDNR